jgi:hypothetical protein
MRLAARHDGLGHVELDVILDDKPGWTERRRVRSTLALDAGALDGLAAAARALDAHGSE